MQTKRDAFQFAKEIATTNPNKAINLVNDAYMTLTHEHTLTSDELADFYYTKVVALFSLDKYYEAINIGVDALEHFAKRPDDVDKIKIYFYVASSQSHTGHYPIAMEILFDALKIATKLDNIFWQARLYNSLGSISEARDDLNRAEEHLNKSIELYLSIDSPGQISATYNNLGIVERKRGNYDMSLKALQQSIHHAPNYGKDWEYAILDELFFTQAMAGYHEEALKTFDIVYQYTQENNFPRLKSYLLYHRGVYHEKYNHYDEALDWLNQSRDYAIEIGLRPTLIDTCDALYRLHKKQGDAVKALEMMEEYRHLRETMFTEHTETSINILHVNHRIESLLLEAKVFAESNERLREEISERLAIEQQLRDANEQLGYEIEASEKLIEELNAYAHTVAHDLKNPLNVISGYSELLLSHHDSDTKTHQWVSRVFSSSRQMQQIIESLLLLATVRQNQIAFVPVNMKAIIDSAIERSAYHIEQSEATIVAFDDDIFVESYGEWLVEVWVNFISNAIKYGGEPPEIIMGYDDMSKTEINFWIDDNGVGITDEVQKALFQPFQRFDVQRAKGHGLGLSIVKRIIERLGGRVYAQRLEPSGSRFGFILPTEQTIRIEHTDAQKENKVKST